MALCHEERDYAMGFSRYNPHASSWDATYARRVREAVAGCRALAAKYRRRAVELRNEDPTRADYFDRLADANAEQAQRWAPFRFWGVRP